jgi:hypothetical protein
MSLNESTGTFPRRLPLVVLGALAAFLLGACAGSTPKPVQLPSPKPAPLDASYDWHVLVTAPFGSLLKDAPLAVHEVLQFRDEAPGALPVDDAECYAVDGTPPRFIDRTPEGYLLCYTHDRLSRIDATVRLPEREAAQIYADACGLWLKNAAIPPNPPAPANSPSPASTAEPQKRDGCSGSAGSIHFSGRLDEEPDHTDTRLVVKLEATNRD